MTKTQTLETLLAALTVGGRMNPEKSGAQERRYYGDPAKFVKFESEKRGGRMDGLIGTKEVERMLRIDLENWLRWGKMRDWRPVSFRCPVGFMYKSSDVHDVSYKPLPAHEGHAAKFERIVIALPEKHRQAFVMYHLGRAAANGQIKIMKGYDDAARLLGFAKSKYYEVLQEAHNIVLREFFATFKK